MSFWSGIIAAEQKLEKVNYYELLGVQSDASATEIDDKYYKLASKFHPDRFAASDNVKGLAALTRVYARLSEAKAILLEPAARRDYDTGLAVGVIRIQENTRPARAVSQHDPSNPMAQSLLEKAMLAASAGEYKAAVADLQLALQFEPSSDALQRKLELFQGSIVETGKPAASRTEKPSSEKTRPLVKQSAEASLDLKLTPADSNVLLDLNSPPPPAGVSLDLNSPPPSAGVSLDLNSPPPSAGVSLDLNSPPPPAGVPLDLNSPPPPAGVPLDLNSPPPSAGVISLDLNSPLPTAVSLSQNAAVVRTPKPRVVRAKKSRAIALPPPGDEPEPKSLAPKSLAPKSLAPKSLAPKSLAPKSSTPAPKSSTPAPKSSTPAPKSSTPAPKSSEPAQVVVSPVDAPMKERPASSADFKLALAGPVSDFELAPAGPSADYVLAPANVSVDIELAPAGAPAAPDLAASVDLELPLLDFPSTDARPGLKARATPFSLGELVGEFIRIRSIPAHLVLGVKADATSLVVREAYEELVRLFHPHNNDAAGDSERMDVCRDLVGVVVKAYRAIK